MKTVWPVLLLIIFGATLHAQDSIKKDNGFEVIVGYGANNMGKYGHLIGGYHLGNSLIYGGLRIQENAHTNPMTPGEVFLYRYDDGGRAIGFIAGFQQRFPMKKLGITPLFFTDLEYAYLNSIEQATRIYLDGRPMETVYNQIPPRSFYLPAVGLGFEVKIIEGLHMKQVIGCSGLFQESSANFRNNSGLEFNGLNLVVRISLLYRF